MFKDIKKLSTTSMNNSKRTPLKLPEQLKNMIPSSSEMSDDSTSSTESSDSETSTSSAKARNTASIPALFLNQDISTSRNLNVKISHLEV